MTIMGIDIGTSGCKASIVREDGAIIASGYQEYSPIATTDGGQEMPSRKIWELTKCVIKEALASYPERDIKAICVSSFGESVTPIGENGEILWNAMLYTDARGGLESNWLESKIDRDRFYALTGYYPDKMFTLSRLIWLKKHKPEIYRAAKVFLPFNSLILYLLGAKPHIEYTLASTTTAFDIINKEWSSYLLDAAEIDGEKLPPIVAPGEVVGTLSSAAASEFGLKPSILLVSGGHDQQCVSLGSGTFLPGIALDGLGSVEAVGLVSDKLVDSKLLAMHNFSIEPHIPPNTYSFFACTTTAGSAYKWCRDCLCKDIKVAARLNQRNPYSIMDAMMPEAPTDLFFLPYLAGAGTPYNDNHAPCVLMGMNLNTRRGDIVKAVLEGICYEITLNVNLLQSIGLTFKELRAVGGLATSPKFLQIKADIMGCDITTLCSNEAGTLGAAMLAGRACGMFQSLEDASDRIVKIADVIHFNPSVHAIYQEKFSRYQEIYPALKQNTKLKEALRSE